MRLFHKLRKLVKIKENNILDELHSKPLEIDNSEEITDLNLTKQLPLNEKEKEGLILCLTVREREIYNLLIEGFTLKEIAKQLGIKYSTVNTHMTGIYRKLNVNTRAELIINYRSINK